MLEINHEHFFFLRVLVHTASGTRRAPLGRPQVRDAMQCMNVGGNAWSVASHGAWEKTKTRALERGARSSELWSLTRTALVGILDGLTGKQAGTRQDRRLADPFPLGPLGAQFCGAGAPGGEAVQGDRGDSPGDVEMRRAFFASDWTRTSRWLRRRSKALRATARTGGSPPASNSFPRVRWPCDRGGAPAV